MISTNQKNKKKQNKIQKYFWVMLSLVNKKEWKQCHCLVYT